MEKSRNTSLSFYSKEIDINPEKYWKELIQLSFVNKEEYVAISRLSYEDEIYIEYNDQVNYIYSLYNDIVFNIENNVLSITILKTIRSSCFFNGFNIIIQDFNSLINIKNAIKKLKEPPV